MRSHLYSRHLSDGARFVVDDGWEVPAAFRGLEAEYRAATRGVALADRSSRGPPAGHRPRRPRPAEPPQHQRRRPPRTRRGRGHRAHDQQGPHHRLDHAPAPRRPYRHPHVAALRRGRQRLDRPLHDHRGRDPGGPDPLDGAHRRPGSGRRGGGGAGLGPRRGRASTPGMPHRPLGRGRSPGGPHRPAARPRLRPHGRRRGRRVPLGRTGRGRGRPRRAAHRPRGHGGPARRERPPPMGPGARRRLQPPGGRPHRVRLLDQGLLHRPGGRGEAVDLPQGAEVPRRPSLPGGRRSSPRARRGAARRRRPCGRADQRRLQPRRGGAAGPGLPPRRACDGRAGGRGPRWTTAARCPASSPASPRSRRRRSPPSSSPKWTTTSPCEEACDGQVPTADGARSCGQGHDWASAVDPRGGVRTALAITIVQRLWG